MTFGPGSSASGARKMSRIVSSEATGPRFLFRNRETGDDNVVARSGGSEYELFEPSATSSRTDTAATIRASTDRPPTIAVEDAVGLLDAGDLPFVFFVDPDTRRGQVLYRRYDGHYGLVSPSQ